MADMASRISNLEKSVAKAREEESSVTTASVSGFSGGTPMKQLVESFHYDNVSDRSRKGILVQKGSSSQYINEIFFSRVIEEEHNIRSVLTPPSSSPLPLVASSPFNALGILSSPSLSLAPASLHPPKELAVKLWNIYVDNVEACTGSKLLHLPTDEVKVYSTIADPAVAPLENLAISFATYFASAVSLDDPKAQITLGQDKHALLLQLKVGLEQTFAHGDFLDRPTITGLTALAIYLSALRVHNHGKAIWILNGLALRIAQSLGLHRDGERLGVSPFQAEIRRRLWWHILSRDGREGEDYGLENTNSLLLSSDVGLPINVDDKDLQPEMQHLPIAKEGWTAMTFLLIIIDLSKTMQKLAGIAASSSSSSPLSDDVRATTIQEMRMRAERYLGHCNPVLPRQRLTLFCSRFLIRKVDFITRLQWTLFNRHGSHTDFATEQNLIEALEILEPRVYGEDALLKQFSWARKAYPQYHAVMYVLWHLGVNPEGPSVERAWKDIDTLFHGELWDETTIGLGPKSAVLLALKEKAVSVRNNIRRLRGGGNARTNTSTSNHCSDSASGDGQFGNGSGRISDAELSLNDGTDDWPDWAALVQGFQLDSPDVFWQ